MPGNAFSHTHRRTYTCRRTHAHTHTHLHAHKCTHLNKFTQLALHTVLTRSNAHRNKKTQFDYKIVISDSNLVAYHQHANKKTSQDLHAIIL